MGLLLGYSQISKVFKNMKMKTLIAVTITFFYLNTAAAGTTQLSEWSDSKMQAVALCVEGYLVVMARTSEEAGSYLQAGGPAVELKVFQMLDILGKPVTCKSK